MDTRAKGLVCKRHGGGGRDLEGFEEQVNRRVDSGNIEWV